MEDNSNEIHVNSNPGELYRGLESVVRHQISEYRELGRNNVRILIYGMVDEARNYNDIIGKVKIVTLLDITSPIDDFNDEKWFYRKLDNMFKNILDNWGYNVIVKIYDYTNHITKNKDTYKESYMEILNDIFKSVGESVLFERICSDTYHKYINLLKERFDKIKRDETWINGFNYIIESTGEFNEDGKIEVDLEVNDFVIGSLFFKIVFNSRTNSLDMYMIKPEEIEE